MPSTFSLSLINQNYRMSTCVYYDRDKILGVFKEKTSPLSGLHPTFYVSEQKDSVKLVQEDFNKKIVKIFGWSNQKLRKNNPSLIQTAFLVNRSKIYWLNKWKRRR